MPSYQEEIARMRMERKQAEAADHYEQLVQQLEEATERRDTESLQILSKGHRYDYDEADRDVEEAERGLVPYHQAAAQQQQNSYDAQWNYLNKDFLARVTQKYGAQRGSEMLEGLSNELVRMGYPKGTPQHYWAIEHQLGTFSDSLTGIPYSEKEKTLTANEACEISGLSPQEYNRASQTLAAQGRFSYQQKR